MPWSTPSRSEHAINRPKRGELAIIDQIRKRARGLGVPGSSAPGVTLGIGDDCALIRPRRGEELAVTTDLTIAGTHFRLDWHAPESVGHRTLARGLSDLAAMGARPVAAFLSLGLPREFANPKGRWSSSWVARYLDGLLALAESCSVPLAGGDLSETPIPLADIVLMGAVPTGKAMLRSGARPGDLLYVTGSIGGGAASLPHLAQLAKQHTGKPGEFRIPRDLQPLLARHLWPQPRIAQGLRLRRGGLASAAMDMSDGLSTDLTHLCDESRVAAEVDSAMLPVHPGASLDYALHGGDDYELLFTASPSTHMPGTIAGVPITRIGRVLRPRKDRPQVTVLTAKGPRPLKPQGWEHFV
jgi:thiamine-monophosphate kinase